MKAEQISVMHLTEPLSDKIHSDKIHSDMLKTLTTTTRELFKNITDVQLNQPTQQLNQPTQQLNQPTQQLNQPTQQQTTQQLKCKTSYGIICYNKGRILLVKKPVTYHFCEFMAGHYQTYDTQYLKFLFSNMTYHEKRAILDMHFEYLWKYVYRMPINATYIKKKNKFDLSFSHKQLSDLMADTPNVDLMWEAPKGRKNSDETDIATAVREFHEETGLTPQDYEIKWDLTPLVERFEDLGTVYQNVYWLAELNNPSVSHLQTTQTIQTIQTTPQLTPRLIRPINSEVADCSWVTLADITPLNMNTCSHARLIALIKKTCDRFKIFKKSKVYNF